MTTSELRSFSPLKPPISHSPVSRPQSLNHSHPTVDLFAPKELQAMPHRHRHTDPGTAPPAPTRSRPYFPLLSGAFGAGHANLIGSVCKVAHLSLGTSSFPQMDCEGARMRAYGTDRTYGRTQSLTKSRCVGRRWSQCWCLNMVQLCFCC